MFSKNPYRTKEFSLSGLNGISDKTLQIHLGLYDGYVKNTNLVLEKLSGLAKNGSPSPEDFPAYSELKRALGFEYNGMVLHEYYFGNLKKDGGGEPARTSSFSNMVEASFGSYENWKAEFVATGKMRGVGWAVCYQDAENGKLLNQWITLHQTGNVAGYKPLLVMDVWEHAFLLDYKPAERPKYIEAFFSNVDWSVVEARVVR